MEEQELINVRYILRWARSCTTFEQASSCLKIFNHYIKLMDIQKNYISRPNLNKLYYLTGLVDGILETKLKNLKEK